MCGALCPPQAWVLSHRPESKGPQSAALVLRKRRSSGLPLKSLLDNTTLRELSLKGPEFPVYLVLGQEVDRSSPMEAMTQARICWATPHPQCW